MIDVQGEFYIIAFFSAWFALVAAVVWRAGGTGKSLDDRHTRRSYDCDEVYAPDEWTVKIGPCEPGDCDECDTRRAKIERERTP